MSDSNTSAENFNEEKPIVAGGGDADKPDAADARLQTLAEKARLGLEKARREREIAAQIDEDAKKQYASELAQRRDEAPGVRRERTKEELDAELADVDRIQLAPVAPVSAEQTRLALLAERTRQKLMEARRQMLVAQEVDEEAAKEYEKELKVRKETRQLASSVPSANEKGGKDGGVDAETERKRSQTTASGHGRTNSLSSSRAQGGSRVRSYATKLGDGTFRLRQRVEDRKAGSDFSFAHEGYQAVAGVTVPLRRRDEQNVCECPRCKEACNAFLLHARSVHSALDASQQVLPRPRLRVKPDAEGGMHVRDGAQWNAAYFVLVGMHLVRYASADDIGRRAPDAVYHVSRHTRVLPDAKHKTTAPLRADRVDDNETHRYPLYIMTALGSGEERWILACGNETERDAWASALRSAARQPPNYVCQRCRQLLNFVPSKTEAQRHKVNSAAWQCVRGDASLRNRQWWVTLRNGHLAFHGSQQAQADGRRPSRLVHLHRATVSIDADNADSLRIGERLQRYETDKETRSYVIREIGARDGAADEGASDDDEESQYWIVLMRPSEAPVEQTERWLEALRDAAADATEASVREANLTLLSPRQTADERRALRASKQPDSERNSASQAPNRASRAPSTADAEEAGEADELALLRDGLLRSSSTRSQRRRSLNIGSGDSKESLISGGSALRRSSSHRNSGSSGGGGGGSGLGSHRRSPYPIRRKESARIGEVRDISSPEDLMRLFGGEETAGGANGRAGSTHEPVRRNMSRTRLPTLDASIGVGGDVGEFSSSSDEADNGGDAKRRASSSARRRSSGGGGGGGDVLLSESEDSSQRGDQNRSDDESELSSSSSSSHRSATFSTSSERSGGGGARAGGGAGGSGVASSRGSSALRKGGRVGTLDVTHMLADRQRSSGRVVRASHHELPKPSDVEGLWYYINSEGYQRAFPPPVACRLEHAYRTRRFFDEIEVTPETFVVLYGDDDMRVFRRGGEDVLGVIVERAYDGGKQRDSPWPTTLPPQPPRTRLGDKVVERRESTVAAVKLLGKGAERGDKSLFGARSESRRASDAERKKQREAGGAGDDDDDGTYEDVHKFGLYDFVASNGKRPHAKLSVTKGQSGADLCAYARKVLGRVDKGRAGEHMKGDWQLCVLMREASDGSFESVGALTSVDLEPFALLRRLQRADVRFRLEFRPPQLCNEAARSLSTIVEEL